MALSTAKVEFSKDDLSVSNASAVWTDISDRVLGIEWWGGKSNDLDAPTSGGATILLDNDDRRFEPDYSASPYYPAIQPDRRFRISITADAVDYSQGIYYAESWDVSYAALTTYAQVSVSCDDGFGVLSVATLPTLSPASASTYADVVAADSPIGYWTLGEGDGRKMAASAGTDGTFKKTIQRGYDSPVVGEVGLGTQIGLDGYGRSPLEDSSIFHDAGAVSGEAVCNKQGTPTISGRHLVVGPFDTGGAEYSFHLSISTSGKAQCRLLTSAVVSIGAEDPGAALSDGIHHLAFTFDGGLLTLYVDGLAVDSIQGSDNIVTPDATEFIYIGNEGNASATSTDGTPIILAHAAVYDYALSAAQVASHATAATNRGYDTQTTGDRVATLATNPLWSVAGITGGQLLEVEPRMQTGQSTLEEINLVAAAEQPSGLFWFDDDGNPAYQGYDYDATIAATFTDTGGSDTEYVAITPKFDNEYYTQVTIAREGGQGQSSDTGAVTARGYNQTGLILNTDSDADLVRAGVYDSFNTTRIRFSEISLDGVTTNGRLQILTREIGDTIRVKIRNDTGEPIDVITRILGKHKTWTPDGNLACTWNLSRGIDASDAHWHLGIVGYSELGNTTILA